MSAKRGARLSKFWSVGKACFGTLVIASLAACKVANQKAEDAFQDGKLPPSLLRAANEWHEFRNLDSIIKRIEEDKKNKRTLEIAVMDNGVDLTHPDLVGKIAFDVENGKLTGAGHDFMGADRWGSSNLIDPSLFAFGAREIKEGKIVGPPPSPMDLMAKMNREFMSELTAKIAADPVLKESLFMKITPESMSVFGAHRLVEEVGDDFERYERMKKEGRLISRTSWERLKKATPSERKSHDPELIHHIVDRKWAMGAKNGLPSYGFDSLGLSGGSNVITQIEHADKFVKLVRETFEAYRTRSGYQAAVDSYLTFLEPREFKPSDERSDKIDKTLEKLSQAHYFKHFGPRAADPIHTVNRALDSLLVYNRTLQEKNQAPFVPAPGEITAALEESLRQYERLVRFFSEIPNKTVEETRQLRDFQKKMGAFREMIDWYKADRSWEGNNQLQPNQATPQSSLYRKYLTRQAHPFFSPDSGASTHGTHVSGIIARQDENIRIVPVRVTTQTVAVNPAELAKLREKFKREFGSWLADPVVFRAVGSKLRSSLPDADFDDLSPANREKTAARVTALLSERIDLSFEQEGLNHVFVDEVEKAIRFIGERKIKLANISLGTDFERVPTAFKGKDPLAEIEGFFSFLQFEFFKHRLGAAIEKHAPNTLFVVASGNDGKWIDGRSRSALPVDISSPFLAEFENAAKNEVAPNNRVANVLAVGSIGPQHDLSSFTNIPITAKTPFVLAQGESILSPVKTTDPSSVQQVFSAKFPELSQVPMLDVTDERLIPFLEAEFPEFKGLKGEDRERMKLRVAYALMKAQKLMHELPKAVQMHLFLKHPTHRARLTGTSMATPAVTGILGRMIIEKARKLGVSPTDLYQHPEFKPDVLIQDVFKKAEPLTKGSNGIALKKLLGDLKYDSGGKSQELEALLESFEKKGAMNNRLSRSTAIRSEAGPSTGRAARARVCEALFKTGGQ